MAASYAARGAAAEFARARKRKLRTCPDAPGPARCRPCRMKALRYLRDAAVFAPCYVLLDWVSYIHPLGPFNITPWNPQPALAIAGCCSAGWSHAPVVLATIVLADVLVRDMSPASGVAAAGRRCIAHGGLCGDRAGAAAGRCARSRRSRSLRQLTAFVAVVTGGSALVAAAFVGVLLRVRRRSTPGSAASGWLRFWVGDAVGVLVTAPLLLVVADARRSAASPHSRGRGETLPADARSSLDALADLRRPGGDPSHHFYLLFLPLIWVAIRARHGGAIVAVGRGADRRGARHPPPLAADAARSSSCRRWWRRSR